MRCKISKLPSCHIADYRPNLNEVNWYLAQCWDQLKLKLAERLIQPNFRYLAFYARLGRWMSLYFTSNNYLTSRDCQIPRRWLAEKLINVSTEEIDHWLASIYFCKLCVLCLSRLNSWRILQYADTAMYESKKSGRNCSTLFIDKMQLKQWLLKLENCISTLFLKMNSFSFCSRFHIICTWEVTSAEGTLFAAARESIVLKRFHSFSWGKRLIIDVGDEDALTKYVNFGGQLKQQALST